MPSETVSTASSSGASSASPPTSPSYRVLWRVELTKDGLRRYVSTRAPSEADALADLERRPPDCLPGWAIVAIQRERNP